MFKGVSYVTGYYIAVIVISASMITAGLLTQWWWLVGGGVGMLYGALVVTAWESYKSDHEAKEIIEVISRKEYESRVKTANVGKMQMTNALKGKINVSE